MPPTLFFFLLLLLAAASAALPKFREAPAFRNGDECSTSPIDIIHISMTLDTTSYLRGSVAAVFSVLQHATCPENTVFHFLASSGHSDLRRTITSTFPNLVFHLYPFDAGVVKNKISSSVRAALDQPLNYARIYLADLLPSSVRRVIYLDSDVILVDDVSRLWSIPLHGRVLGAPEYCHANFSSYFTPSFWSHPRLSRTFKNSRSRTRRPPCYFNTGVMVIDLWKWRRGGFTAKLETWMEIQKRHRIYELGSLPPFLLVFAGSVKSVEHRWNQHGLGGDNLQGQCRDLHSGPVSLLHWSGKGKPWLRIDAERACPLDSLWGPIRSHLSSLLFARFAHLIFRGNERKRKKGMLTKGWWACIGPERPAHGKRGAVVGRDCAIKAEFETREENSGGGIVGM